jgi:imidazolonepropionase-like amidohydrolase
LFFAGPQLDGSRRYFPFAVHITGKRRMEWELERARRLGYAALKTYTRMPNERQQQLIAAAHELGIPVTSHEAYPALALGADRVEHLRGNSRLGFSSKQSDLLRSYADVVAIAGATGATVSPTVVTSGGFFAYVLAHPELANNRQYRSLWPEAKRRGAAGLAMMAGRNAQLLDQGVTNARQAIFDLHQAGAQIVAGTDSPIFPYGLALIVELANYRAAGLSPFDTLRTATAGAAQAMGAAGDLGVIEAGALADMVIIDGDPLADVTDLMNVNAVISNGRYYSLDDLLE